MIPTVIFIEWTSLITSTDDFYYVRCSEIPENINSLLRKTPQRMKLWWHEDVLQDLYDPFDSNFKEFVKNTKSLIADQFHSGKSDILFIFGTKWLLSKLKAAITSWTGPQELFAFVACPATFKNNNDIYYVREPKRSNEILVVEKANSFFVSKHFMVQPHPR